jgi:hypothetical protein
MSLIVSAPLSLNADTIWLEGEQADETSLTSHSWYGNIKTQSLSGESLAHHWDPNKAGLLRFHFKVPEEQTYTLWLRANPVQSALTWQVDGESEQEVNFKTNLKGRQNIAADGKVDLRFIAWVDGGQVSLPAGNHTLTVRFTSSNHHHGYLDALVLTSDPFQPRGILKPGEQPDYSNTAEAGWSVWYPHPDLTTPGSNPIDLRFLNQEQSGQDGRVLSKEGQFYFEKTGETVRFWGVNGPPAHLRGEALQHACRRMAAQGVNLFRLHGKVFDEKTGAFQSQTIEHFHAVADAAAENGIYLHLSIYFPLWMKPAPGLPWLEGYDGTQHPFAALQINPEFQQQYQDWWNKILLTPGPSGIPLIQHPALMGLEIQNEDSFFFWTFDAKKIPPAQLQILERQLGEWVKQKYGSIEKAYQAWDNLQLPQDQPEQPRLAFRPLWNISHERTARDRDTVAFLFETQHRFYQQQVNFLRQLGFRGLITASNWHTVDARLLGDVERMSYFPGDFIDRHGYFGNFHDGQGASWSIRKGHRYSNRSALRFDPKKPGEAATLSHPVMDHHYNDYPSMISETAWTRPNRYRGEAPLFYALFGALQDSDALIHFACDTVEWEVQPGAFMQPWTLMSPTQAAQWPAAALIYRQGLIKTGPVVANIHLSAKDLLNLKGTPLAVAANLDTLRAADFSHSPAPADSLRSDLTPLIHYLGRTQIHITDEKQASEATPVSDLSPYLDFSQKIIRSSTGEIVWNYGQGWLQVDSPQAQVFMGNAGQCTAPIHLTHLNLESEMEALYLALVPLDGRPVATSEKLLLQVMTEEKTTGFATTEETSSIYRIDNTGTDPWQFKSPQGRITIKLGPTAGELDITPLHHNGTASKETIRTSTFSLLPNTVYYLIEPH